MANTLPAPIDHMLPSNSTYFERALAAAVGVRMRDIPVPLKLLNDPYKVPAGFLDHLAYEVGVDIWHEEWDELQKRSVIATTIRTKEILGTAGGISAYIGMEGGVLIDTVTPPQTPFVSQALTDAQLTEWLGLLPQLRVYYGDNQGAVDKGQSFVGVSFVGVGAVETDAARSLLGRQAFLYDPQTDTEARITMADIGVDENGARTEQVYIPGIANPNEAIIGKSFVGLSFVTSKSISPPTTLTYTLPEGQAILGDIGSLILSLAESFDPVFPRTDRVPVYKPRRNDQSFVGEGFVGSAWVGSADGAINFYDRLYLSDPTVATPATVGTSYVGISRLQMDPFQAEMLIDAQETIPPTAAVEGRFVGNCFVFKQDDTKRNAILTAIEMSKAGRDRIYVDFQVTKPLTFGDAPVMDGSFSLDQRLPRDRL